MTIHVVRPGDTVWMLARRYGVSMDSIVSANGLQDIPHLVVGQALVIPTRESGYLVKPGDSLWSISRKFNVSVAGIAALNGISVNATIYPGMILRIPQSAKNYGFVEVNAFIEPSTSQAEAEQINEVGRYLTYISPFSYQVMPDGGLTSLNDTVMVETGRRNRTAALMVLTNFRNGNFDTALAHTVLSNDNIQNTLIENVANTMKRVGYYGLIIDFERVDPADRQLYNSFLRRITSRLHQQNYIVGSALAPKTSDALTGAWYGAHDYRAHGEILDFVILMTYEWGWSGGPPFAVAPINFVRPVIEYAVSVIPRKKIFMGVPLYGYNWRLPYKPGNPFARRVSPQDAIKLAARYNASILYDYKVQSPYFYYYDEDRVQHVVWFEDARSVQAKYLLLNEFALRGVSYWELGLEFPQNWAVLDNMFNIVKVIP